MPSSEEFDEARRRWDEFIQKAKARRKQMMKDTMASITLFEEMRDNGQPFPHCFDMVKDDE